MLRFLYILVLAVGAVFLQGCTVVRSEVAVFHRLGESGKVQTYTFIPLKGQAESLEYQAYRELIRSELAAYNYQNVDASKADLALYFGYGIDSGTEKLTSEPVYGYGGWGYGYSRLYGRRGPYATYGIVGRKTVTETLYSSFLWVHLNDMKTVGTDKVARLYEGTVKSRGESSQLPNVMPAMIKALFKEFPGENGSVRKVSIQMDKD